MQKLGPIMMDYAGEVPDEAERERLCHPSTGGLILFARNYSSLEQIRELISETRSLRSEVLIAVDYEGGRVQRFGEPFFQLPPMRKLGEQYDQYPGMAVETAAHHGWMIGAELRALDIDLAFAPVLDLDYASCDVIGDRALHSDLEVVIKLATSHMQGMQSAGMSATGKHYPGHGHVIEDSHHELPIDNRAAEELREQDEQPFAELIAAGLDSVMMAHIVYPAIDDLFPASLSAPWIRDELRGRLGFSGAVFCDDLSMGGAAALGDYGERAKLAMQAGCDMLPVCNNSAEAERLAEQISDSRDENSAERLLKLRGKSAPDWKHLRKSAAWEYAADELETLRA